MKIGDKVRFLSEVGGGIVSGFQDKDTVLVRDEDGFDIPMPVRECVVVETDDYNIAKVNTGTHDKKKLVGERAARQFRDEDEEDDSVSPEPLIQLEFEEPGFWDKIKSGMRWSFTELSVTICKYTVSGMLIAGLIFNVVPQSFIQDYLGQPGFVSLLGITVIAALMYVCAVGHIPFIAALVASGAAPGVAITFLMAGAGTNIPELLTISKMIGKRAMIMYFAMVVIISNIVGYLTNRLLMPGFTPVLDYNQTQHTISYANKMIISFPDWAQHISSVILICYAIYALYKYIKGKTTNKAAV